MDERFQLHPKLQEDSLMVGDFPLSRLLLMNECQFPWCVLVPRRMAIREIYQLSSSDRMQLMQESCALAEAMQELYLPDKLNIAAIGNLVPQLHLHHVARFENDLAWPAPIWGKFGAVPYTETEGLTQVAKLRLFLKTSLVD